MITANWGPINLQLDGKISDKLTAEAFEIRKYILNFSLAKPKENAEAVLKSCELFIYGDASYISNSFCNNVLKIATP